MPTYPFRGLYPTLGDGVFIAPGARVIGDVVVGARSSVWFNCVLRGDVNEIRIGAGTNIQDGSIVHVSRKTHGTFIGDDVLIGHACIIHGCELQDGAFIGMGATVMDGCVVETDAMLAAGSLLTPGKRIPARQMWAGRPARFVRDLSADEVAGHRKASAHYAELAAEYVGA
ncbi:gamma carbonic anhydrase family protein [Govanella unica]|uniref:Gamma carbonic anhydrase family protein n=1 Tax=Govanella unica TaxID=2975056 RepID=A0A9X3Z7D2_9PROT|nr:gamma carbonic anhydrase family protein [Govania unica]MDA5194115.1 gamma carbonic anhydrase family protein [Govania unica]